VRSLAKLAQPLQTNVLVYATCMHVTKYLVKARLLMTQLAASSKQDIYPSTIAHRFDRSILWAYGLFWYLTGVTQFLIGVTRTGSFEGFKDATLTAFLWLIPVLLVPTQAKKMAGFVAILIWLTALPGFGYFLVYRQELTQSLIFIIFESNKSESTEYFQNYISWGVGLGFVLFTMLPIFIWSKIKPITLNKSRQYQLLACILLLLFAYPASKLIKHDLATAYKSVDRHFSVSPPWQLLFGYLHYQTELAEVEQNLLDFKKIPPLHQFTEQTKPVPTTIVLVIGESTSRLHMGLYGYHRDTTPKLSSIQHELKVFQQVFASRPNTIESLEQVLTFADQQHPDWYKSKPSLLAMMKQAGYRTYWVTNQQTLTARNTMLTTFAKQADEQIFLNVSRRQNAYSYDEKVLAPYQELLNRQDEKKLIVVHLLGTHMKYDYRYPEAYDYYHDAKGLPQGLTEDQVNTVNAYDNANRYNDMVVYTLIDKLKRQQQHSVLFYFSDHGDDVFDSPPHDFQGRNEGRPTYAMYAIPFIIWHSPDWLNANKLQHADILNRQYDNADFIHTFSDLVGLQYDGYLPQESVVNPAFMGDPILVGNPFAKSLKQLVDTKAYPEHDAP
jgi:heptose-I-phosphate ethanolaminephosphotransferase